MKYTITLAILLIMSSLQASTLRYYNCEDAEGTIKLKESNKQSASDYHAGSNESGEKWTIDGLEFLIPSFSGFADIQDGKFGIKTRDVAEETCTRLVDKEVVPGNSYTVRVRHTERNVEINYIAHDGEWKTTTVKLACEYVGDYSYCSGWDAEYQPYTSDDS